MAARAGIRLGEARRAMRALLEDPDDTAQAFRVIAAMSGRPSRRLRRRFRRSPFGARILHEKWSLLEITGDLARLRAMREGSLGRAIADFYETEQISAQALVAASQAGRRPSDALPALEDDERILAERLRDLHDVFHVLAGYGRDLRGEAAVLAFTLAQTWNVGIAFILLTVLRRAGLRSEFGRLIRDGFRRGRRATWLVDLPWEDLLARPLHELRIELGVGPPPAYTPLRSAGAPALA